MRICILTQPIRSNYGGILQAYALQKTLKDMGHDVTTLLFHPPISWVPSGIRKYLLTGRRFLAKYIKGNKDIVYCNPDRQTRFAYREMDRFISEHLSCLEARTPLSLQDLPAFDAFVVGSDQVWRPAYSPWLPDFYLDFLGDAPVKRIAYAASFGVDKWEADEQMTARIRPLAQKFDAITVREESGISLCEKYLGVDAVTMPDPTLLLQDSDYFSLCQPATGEQKPYIATYMLDREDSLLHFADRMSKRLGIPVKDIGEINWAKCADSPAEWIKCIAGASLVLTDSFHGTVFSLLFKRNFFSIVNHARGASRFESLLDFVGLREHLVDRCDLENFDPDLTDIDYSPVSRSLAALRQKGLQFLQTL